MLAVVKHTEMETIGPEDVTQLFSDSWEEQYAHFSLYYL